MFHRIVSDRHKWYFNARGEKNSKNQKIPKILIRKSSKKISILANHLWIYDLAGEFLFCDSYHTHKCSFLAYLVRFVGGIVPHLIQRHLFVSLVIIHPLLIGSHNVAVRPVGGRPVEHIVVSDMLCVIWTLKEV